MIIDSKLRLTGDGTSTTPHQDLGAITATVVSDNWIDLETARAVANGRPLDAVFSVTEAFNSNTENATLELQLVTVPKTLSTPTTEQTFTFTGAAGTVCTAAAHGLPDHTRVTLTTSAADLPLNLATATSYYIVNSASGTFGLSLTPGGTPETMGDAGTGTHTVTWYPEVIASSGAIGLDRLQVGAVVSLRMNPELDARMPANTLLYARFVPSATLTAGMLIADMVMCAPGAPIYHPSALSN